jgi:hypothetical protein
MSSPVQRPGVSAAQSSVGGVAQVGFDPPRLSGASVHSENGASHNSSRVAKPFAQCRIRSPRHSVSMPAGGHRGSGWSASAQKAMPADGETQVTSHGFSKPPYPESQ